MIENKEVMARNIKRLMEGKQVKAMDVCRALDIKQPTFSDWINAKTYPRIDKIEKMARYFGVSQSDLVEARPVTYHDAALIDRAMTYYKKIQSLSPEQKKSLDDYLSFLQSGSDRPY